MVFFGGYAILEIQLRGRSMQVDCIWGMAEPQHEQSSALGIDCKCHPSKLIARTILRSSMYCLDMSRPKSVEFVESSNFKWSISGLSIMAITPLSRVVSNAPSLGKHSALCRKQRPPRQIWLGSMVQWSNGQ